MNTSYPDINVALLQARLRREEQIERSMLREYLASTSGRQTVANRIRATLSSSLITIGQTIKPQELDRSRDDQYLPKIRIVS